MQRPPVLRLLLLAALLASTASSRDETEADLQAAIHQAIDRGIVYLRKQQYRDGSFGNHPPPTVAHRDRRGGLTAFCLYTLLKCGLPLDDPTLVRGLGFLRSGTPTHTYSIAAEVLALAATGDSQHHTRIEELTELLLAVRPRAAQLWGYPKHPSISVDLSNSQFTAMALHAAQKVGVKVKPALFEDLIEGAFPHQEEARAVQDPSDHSATGGRRDIAAYTYLRPAPRGQGNLGYTIPSASMTTAAIALLETAADALGSKLKNSMARKIERSRRMALDWLDHHFTIAENTDGPDAWLYYYLYGLERVGSLLRVDTIGRHEWYEPGARLLAELQKKDGSWQTKGKASWPPKPLCEANTCFALLFLARATSSTGRGMSSSQSLRSAENSPVHLQVSLTTPASLWITGFAEEVLQGRGAEGLKLQAVEYLVDDEVIAKVEADASSGWRPGDRFPAQFAFPRQGSYVLQARARCDAGTLESEPLQVAVFNVLEDWMVDYSDSNSLNLLSRISVELAASSQRTGDSGPHHLLDNLQHSGWQSGEEDASPWIELIPERSIHANTVLVSPLWQPETQPTDRARIRAAVVYLNRSRKPYPLVFPDDPHKKAMLQFEGRTYIRHLKIEITERSPAQPLQPVGLAEIELQQR